MVKKIVNVYQTKYLNYTASGLGDYIRGCFTLKQMVNMANEESSIPIEFGMDLRNHPISKYIITDMYDSSIDYSQITNLHIPVVELRNVVNKNNKYYKLNLHVILEYLNSRPNHIHYTICAMNNIFTEIKEEDKEYIRSYFRPNEYMNNYIDSILRALSLERRQYSILHIRCLDEQSFPPVTINDAYYKKIDNLVKEVIDSEKSYIVISTHNGIKSYLSKYPNVFIRTSHICHTGYDITHSDDSIRDTMLDFFLIANSQSIVCLSEYSHGSGFSLETAKLYNIPYKLIHLYCMPRD
jgi:hypothetical protein